LTYLNKLLKDKKFKNRFNKEYEELCDKLDSGTDKEKNDAELEMMGRILYYEGD